MIDMAKAHRAYISEYMRVRRLGHCPASARIAAMMMSRRFLLA